MKKLTFILSIILLISCSKKEGCTDALSCNYDDTADIDDGTCYTCFENDCENYNAEYYDCFGACIEDTDSDGVCDELEVSGCMDDTACNFDLNATDDEGCEYIGCYCSCNFDFDFNNNNICDSEESNIIIHPWELSDGFDNDDDWHEWAEIGNWNDDKDGDGNNQDLGEWGLVCQFELGAENELIFFHPYQFMNSGVFNFYTPPLSDCIFGTLDFVGVDEFSSITGLPNYPIDYNSISYSLEENGILNLSWQEAPFYMPPIYFDEFGNTILIEGDVLEYQIAYNSNFDFRTCEINDFFSSANHITTTETEVVINNIESGTCFYINSKSANASFLNTESQNLSNFINCLE